MVKILWLCFFCGHSLLITVHLGNSAKFHKNVEIPRQMTNSAARIGPRKTVCFVYHRQPFCAVEKVTAVTKLFIRAHQNCRPANHYRAIRWLVHWPLMGGLLHFVQRGGAWVGCYGNMTAGCCPAQFPLCCTKCNSPPINCLYLKIILFDVALYSYLCTVKGQTRAVV